MTDLQRQPIAVSIVSHGQGQLVASLLADLARCDRVAQVLLTHNIPESDVACPESLRGRLQVIRNALPKGFSANHNQAFQQCSAPLFAVLNPDIRLGDDPFPALEQALERRRAGVAAPMVRNPEGEMEDSARYFPTPAQLLGRLLGWSDGRFPVQGETPLAVDWVGGMFMLFRAQTFREIGGFDEGFFLYCEDVDICVRMWKRGHGVVIHPGTSVVHAAQRTSRKRLRYMVWHVSSLARYFRKHLGRLPRISPDT